MSPVMIALVLAGIMVVVIMLLLVRRAGSFFRGELGSLGKAWIEGRGAFLIGRWRLARAARRAVFEGFGWVLLTGSVVVIARAGMFSWGVLSTTSPATENEGAQLPGILLEVALIVAALEVLRRRIKDWKLRQRERAAPRAVREFLPDARQHIGRRASDPTDLAAFFETVMAHLCRYLGMERKAEFAASLVVRTADGKALETQYIVPDDTTQVNKESRLAMSNSAAGTAHETAEGIYVPSIKHRAAVFLDTWQWAGVVFAPQSDKTNAKSMICLPLLQDGLVKGVVNVSSDYTSAFDDIDVHVASLAVELLSEVEWANSS